MFFQHRLASLKKGANRSGISSSNTIIPHIVDCFIDRYPKDDEIKQKAHISKVC